MEKIFHVFVSSTYRDLIDERKKVSEALSRAGYVAEGMEIFPAAAQKQMDFIERMINRCDYYILIVAGRYGSIAEDGQSYTEKEYLYAKSRGIPVLALIHKNIDEIPGKFQEANEEIKLKLATFTETLKRNSLVDFWNNPDDLAARALAALAQARGTHEGIGWVRGNTTASSEILSELNNVRKENEELRRSISTLNQTQSFNDIDIAGLDEYFLLPYTFKSKHGRQEAQKSEVKLKWGSILAAIGPHYRSPSNTSGMQYSLPNLIKKAHGSDDFNYVSVDYAEENLILMQMEALGLMRADSYSLKGGGQAVFHQLTEQGVAAMLRESVVRSKGSRSPG